MKIVVGVDGCKKGWLGAIWRGPGHSPDAILFNSLCRAEAELPRNIAAIGVDIPLGLSDVAVPGGRECDREARKLLGPRASSVFSPPALAALSADGYREACEINQRSGPTSGRLSKQSHALFPKLREARSALETSNWFRERVIEVHPEVSFRTMARAPLKNHKKRTAGADERRRLLQDHGFQNMELFEIAARTLRAASDDALDACAAAWSAWRRASGFAGCLPNGATGDSFSMKIWF